MEQEAHEFYRLAKGYRLDQRRAYYERLRVPLKLYERNCLSGSVARYWLKKIKPWIEDLEKCPIPFPLAPDQEQLGTYDVEFGHLTENPTVKAGFRVCETPKHLIVAGSTGSGKSTLLRRVIIGLDEYIRKTGEQIVVLAIDLKGDFVDLPAKLGKDRWNHYSIHDGFHMGCHPPSDCTNQIGWINYFTKLIAACCQLEFSEGVLAAVMRIAINKLNDPLTKELAWPSLLLMYELLKALPSKLIAKKPQYKQSLEQKLEDILRSSGRLFEAEEGFDILKHMIMPGKNAVIDGTMLDPILTLIFVNLLASQLSFSRIYQRKTSRKVNFVLVMDESDLLCSRYVSTLFKEGYSRLGQLLKQGREFGIMVCLGMTYLGYCDPFISSNAGTIVVLQQCDHDSLMAASKSLLEPNSRTLLQSLGRGQAVFRESFGSVPYGVLLTTEDVTPSDQSRPKSFDSHPSTPPRTINDIPKMQEAVDRMRQSKEGAATEKAAKGDAAKKGKESESTLSKEARNFLDYAALHEFEPVSCLFRRMGITSPGKQLNIIKELEKKELTESVQFRGSRSLLRLVHLREEAWLFLNKKSEFKPLRGGIVHTHACRWIQFWGQKNGYDMAECEWQIPGTAGFCDVVLKRDRKTYAYEVVVESRNIQKHVRDCLIESKSVDVLAIVTRLKSEWKRIQTTILSDPVLAPAFDRIEFDVIDTYMKGVFGGESH